MHTEAFHSTEILAEDICAKGQAFVTQGHTR